MSFWELESLFDQSAGAGALNIAAIEPDRSMMKRCIHDSHVAFDGEHQPR